MPAKGTLALGSKLVGTAKQLWHYLPFTSLNGGCSRRMAWDVLVAATGLRSSEDEVEG